eukprot:TRINITY_DN51520_c0_g1_i1.p1 TRINITY_DN51520_c0_g1~~TRINITY_DN51520_c0_g1_i1.p1  ORF type:complete len:713 (+),score=90.30 TRINITY_DN51520_c0_g1_i1:155-2293(+)
MSPSVSWSFFRRTSLPAWLLCIVGVLLLQTLTTSRRFSSRSDSCVQTSAEPNTCFALRGRLRRDKSSDEDDGTPPARRVPAQAQQQQQRQQREKQQRKNAGQQASSRRVSGSSGRQQEMRSPPMPASLERQRINVVWFKTTDLRVHDHAPLQSAHAAGGSLPVLHLFVFEPVWYQGRTPLCGLPKTGAKRAQFQLECLADLRSRLDDAGHRLAVYMPSMSGLLPPAGPWAAAEAFRELGRHFDIAGVYASHEICDEELRQLKAVEAVLKETGSGPLNLFWTFELYHNNDLPFDPRRKSTGTYSSFRKAVEERSRVRPPLQEAQLASTQAAIWPGYDDTALPNVAELVPPEALYDLAEDGRAEFLWKGGETAALKRLENYLFETDALGLDYVGATMTTNPSKSVLNDGALSKLSPWLAHGCLSPRFLHAEVKRYEKERTKGKSTYWILHELVWRDFVRYSSVYHGKAIFQLGGPQTIKPTWTWSRDQDRFNLWKTGKTGYPFIDAFMRELECTGYCNHMGRESAGWFLVRDLGLDWRMGAEWFESVLLDYEPAANWYNWVYRCLSTAAGVKEPGQHLTSLEVLLWGAQHDPEAQFMTKWLPELRPLSPTVSATTIREPWRLRVQSMAKPEDLEAAATLEENGAFFYGQDYPLPMVPPVQFQGLDVEKVAGEARDAQEKRRLSVAKARSRLQNSRASSVASPRRRQEVVSRCRR